MAKSGALGIIFINAAQGAPAAMCLMGPGARLPPAATWRQQRRAAEALKAKVFLLLSFKRVEEMSQEHPAEAHWVTEVYRAHEGRGRQSLVSDFHRFAKNSSILEDYRKIPGNFLAPLATLDGQNAFHLRNLWHCYQLFLAEEQSRGEVFKYWIWNRLDWHWLEPPPSLDVFDALPKAVWIPDGSDWDGLNDRFALVPRRYGKIYFNRWPGILNGSLYPMMRAAAPESLELSPEFYGGPEWSLMAALHWGRVPVRRFTSTGAVLCLNSRRFRYGKCTRPTEQLEFSYKYSAEVSEAHGNVERLKLGWSYFFGPPPIFEPPCFEQLEEQQDCCNRRLHGVAGNTKKCWSDVYDYSRCCQYRHGLYLLPTPTAASEILEAGTVPLCWSVVAAVQRCVLHQHLEMVLADEKS